MSGLKRLGLAVVLATVSAASQAYTIDDNYVGSRSHSQGDVIGEKSLFDIAGMDTSVTGTMLSVTVYTNFDNTNAIGSYKHYTYGHHGIGLGDLFLANDWTPHGPSSNGYNTDDASNGTQWLYALSLDNRYTTGGSLSLVKLNDPNNGDVFTSDDFIKNNATYRNGQAVAADLSKATTVKDGSGKAVTGSWNVVDNTKGYGAINFQIDLAFTGLLSGDNLAFHWGETCGNDVIEGQTPLAHVPEPGTLALFGLGLVGLAGRRLAKR